MSTNSQDRTLDMFRQPDPPMSTNSQGVEPAESYTAAAVSLTTRT